MTAELTSRQATVLRFVAAYTAEHGYPPTLRGICRGIGIRSTNGIHDHLAALGRKGMVTVARMVARGIVPTPAGLAWLEQHPERGNEVEP